MRSKFELLDDGDTNTDDIGPDLISLADLKLALGISDDTDADDEALAAEITLWSEVIAEYLDRRLGFARVRETFIFEMYESSLSLVLQQYPIVDVDSVVAGWSLAEFDFDSELGVLYPAVGAVWSGVVVVEYSGGYVLPEGAPGRLRMAIIEAIRSAHQLASSTVSTGGGGTQTVREITHGDTHIAFATAQQTSQSSSAGSAFLPITVVDLIKPLKRVSV